MAKNPTERSYKKPALENSDTITLRIPNELNIAIRRIANQRSKGYQVLIREVLEDFIHVEQVRTSLPEMNPER